MDQLKPLLAAAGIEQDATRFRHRSHRPAAELRDTEPGGKPGALVQPGGYISAEHIEKFFGGVFHVLGGYIVGIQHLLGQVKQKLRVHTQDQAALIVAFKSGIDRAHILR
mgnify:FL=1